MEFLKVKSVDQLQEEYELFVNLEMKKESQDQNPGWSSSIAVGKEGFINEIKNKLGSKVVKRKIDQIENNWILHEPGVSYG